MRKAAPDKGKTWRLYIRFFCCFHWTALPPTAQTTIATHSHQNIPMPLPVYKYTPTPLPKIPFNWISLFFLGVASGNIANMCLQYVCHICGKDLENDGSLVLCFNSRLTPWLSGNHQNCPHYTRPKASASSLCSFCLEVDFSVPENFWEPAYSSFDHPE